MGTYDPLTDPYQPTTAAGRRHKQLLCEIELARRARRVAAGLPAVPPAQPPMDISARDRAALRQQSATLNRAVFGA